MLRIDEWHDLVDAVRWTNERFSYVASPCDERAVRAIGCLDNALRHQESIAFLGSLPLHAGTAVTLRVMFDEVVRGFWLAHCATKSDMWTLRQGRRSPPTTELLSIISQHCRDSEGSDKAASMFFETAIGGLANADLYPLIVRQSKRPPRVRYAESHGRQIYVMATVLGLLAAALISEIAQDLPLFEAACERMQSIGFVNI